MSFTKLIFYEWHDILNNIMTDINNIINDITAIHNKKNNIWAHNCGKSYEISVILTTWMTFANDNNDIMNDMNSQVLFEN